MSTGCMESLSMAAMPVDRGQRESLSGTADGLATESRAYSSTNSGVHVARRVASRVAYPSDNGSAALDAVSAVKDSDTVRKIVSDSALVWLSVCYTLPTGLTTVSQRWARTAASLSMRGAFSCR
jgi:hypothetical protein